MSAAILAKTAKERARIAIRIIRYNVNPFTRELVNCFEMGDGDEVMRIVYSRALLNPILMEKVSRVFDRGTLERVILPKTEVK